MVPANGVIFTTPLKSGNARCNTPTKLSTWVSVSVTWCPSSRRENACCSWPRSSLTLSAPSSCVGAVDATNGAFCTAITVIVATLTTSRTTMMARVIKSHFTLRKIMRNQLYLSLQWIRNKLAPLAFFAVKQRKLRPNVLVILRYLFSRHQWQVARQVGN